MKNIPQYIILLWGLFFSIQSGAQSWPWGRANTGAGVDAWAVATDKSGNVFVAGIKWGITPAVFGATVVPFTGITGGYQCIVAKYDAAGNFLWARGTEY